MHPSKTYASITESDIPDNGVSQFGTEAFSIGEIDPAANNRERCSSEQQEYA